MNPLQFEPLLKRLRWGGRRLATHLDKSLGEHSDYAESWEIADHGDDQSIVIGGEFAGWTLSRLMREHGTELLGPGFVDDDANATQFPLLVKFLDAHDRLSVQVHPHDELARQYDPTENGKTEAWVVIAADLGSLLYAGLRQDVDESQLRRALEAGEVETLLHTIVVKPGDCLFVPAGTVHAIGEGILLAEIQQQSDLTFRLYDWGRVDADGRPRAIHIEESIACIDFQRGPLEVVTPQPTDQTGRQRLVDCEQFVIDRIITDAPLSFSNDDRCHVLMTLAGNGTLADSWIESTTLNAGQTVLLPASCTDAVVTPQGEITLLDAYLPACE